MTVVSIILAGLAGFLAFWAGVVSLVGFGGWRPLAARYPARRWPEGEGTHVGWQSGRVGMANYNGALNAVVTGEGLYLRPVALFKYNHPPIFIPWEAVEATKTGWLGGLRLDLDGGGGVTVSGRLAREVRRAFDAWRTTDAVFASPEADLLGPDGDTISDEAWEGSGWRRTRTR